MVLPETASNSSRPARRRGEQDERVDVSATGTGSPMPTGPPSAPIIRRKVTPPSPPETAVSRPRVEALAADLISSNRIICVYATAGAGKTTAVRQAIRHVERPLAWLSVDGTDSAPGRLLTYLEAALVRAIPGVTGAVNAALASRLSHPESAGLLADSIGEEPVLLVLDDLERISASEDALAVLGAFARYLPPTARLVLISRKELPFGPTPSSLVVAIDESALAFTHEEAAKALARTGRRDIDVSTAIEATGGWVTGVLFEAWRSTAHACGLGGEADPLYGYLALHILDQLTSDQRNFLIFTAVLDEVTASAAAALGIPAAAQQLHSLHAVHLPASWDHGGAVLRCHPRFREYLLERLQRCDQHEVEDTYRSHARLLLAQHHFEEATEEFLEAGALDEAIAVAEKALDSVVERADFAVARRWLTRLEPVRRDHHTALAGAELMLALANEDYRGGLEITDRLAASGYRDQLAGSSSKLAAVMAWCYFHAGRLDDIRAVLDAGRPGVELDAMRYCMSLIDSDHEGEDFTTVPLSGGPLDALIMRTHYYHGRLPLLLEEPTSRWAARAAESWRLGALLAMGQVEEAADLYRVTCEVRDPGVWSFALFRVELLREQGRRDEAWRALLQGRERIRASGSAMLETFSYLEEAELELRLNRDPRAAHAVLAKVQAHPVGSSYRFVSEQTETWLGLALLLEDNHQAAAECLRRAVTSMHHSRRVLVLPAAAVYLAEAEWRLDNEAASDRAMDLALASAERQGSNHTLLDALSEFPSALSRRLDAEPTAESPWHRLGRALMARGVALNHQVGADVHVVEFGRLAIEVDGADVWPQITKSYELLAFLASRLGQEATRDVLLAALFGGRQGASSASYLRQAIRRLREILPDEGSVDVAEGRVRLTGRARVKSESEQLDRLVTRAADLRGHDRYSMLLHALTIVGRGEYLPGVSSPWAEERRQQLASTILDTSCEAAELAFGHGDYQRAAVLIEAILQDDPFRESIWRLSMRLADATGDPDGVIAAYRQCERALHELGTSPCQTTSCLLDDLRR